MQWMDYNPVLGRISSVRHVEYELIGTIEDLQKLLDTYPDAKIVHTLMHEPYISPHESELIMGKLKTIQEVAAYKRVKEEGREVIDEFGFHVYLKADIDFTGTVQDTDLRY
jgi:hypothetical protein